MMHEIVVPGDKSISHRALILSALADGTSRIRRILRSHDVLSTAEVLRRFGVSIPTLSDDLEVRGAGLRGLRAPTQDLDCGNSGTTARLLCGVAAGCDFVSRFIGDASLSRRPMRRVTDLLTQMGATATFDGPDGLPLTISGGELRDFTFRNETGSAQLKSALLLAGLVGRATVSVSERVKSRDHTELMLLQMGATIDIDGSTVTVRPTDRLQAIDIVVPGDPSSAAFFAAFAAMAPGRKITLAGISLNPTRMGFFRVLEKMGAGVVSNRTSSPEDPDVVGDVVVSGAPLHGIDVGSDEIPQLVDELPLLACVATCAEGETRVTGAGELRHKESDRVAAIVRNLISVGASATERQDGFLVKQSAGPLKGRVTTYGDHRIAMSFGILGAQVGNAISVDDPDCVAVSYPDFWQALQSVTVA
jgi:3-phosphoshikimate 1-carboxyvinyltransferase